MSQAMLDRRAAVGDTLPMSMRAVTHAVALLGTDDKQSEQLVQAASDLRYQIERFDSVVDLQSELRHFVPTIAVALHSPQRPVCTALFEVIDRQRLATSVIAVGDDWHVDDIVQLLRRGVADVLQTPVEAPRLQQAFARAAEQHRQLAEDRELVDTYRRRIARLSPDEAILLPLVCTGEPNKAIAGQLKLSIRTVEHRRSRIFRKMGVSAAAALASYVTRAQVIDELAARRRRSRD